jgi:hypothetical protein
VSRLGEVIEALAELKRLEEAEELARNLRQNAEVALAEVTATKRRDKDTGFEAEHNAKDLIVKAALAGDLVPTEGAE